MNIFAKIQAELKTAIKTGDSARRDALRVILGEFQRQATKDIDDKLAVKIISKLAKSEKERLGYTGEATSAFLEVAESFLPRMMSEEEIRTWIKKNIDLSQYKSPLQAMGTIMKELSGKADGNLVKKVLQK